MLYPTTEQIKSAFAGDTYQMNRLTVRGAWGALKDCLSDVLFLAEQGREVPWTKYDWKAYHRINAAKELEE